VHQAAVVLKFGVESLNYIATLSANARLKIATIALGSGAVKELSFYSSLHQQALEDKYKTNPQDLSCKFEGTGFDLIRSMGDHHLPEIEDEYIESPMSLQNVCSEVDDFASSLKQMINHGNDQQLINGTVKFLQRYKSLSGLKSTARLASALHQFGWIYGGSISRASTKMKLRRGKRICIQATSAGRRRAKTKRGKSRVPSGRPCRNLSQPVANCDLHSMPTRSEPKGKRVHLLHKNILKGQQNAGKW
jgi:hypothetical protein